MTYRAGTDMEGGSDEGLSWPTDTDVIVAMLKGADSEESAMNFTGEVLTCGLCGET
jgi:hypothetical protein